MSVGSAREVNIHSDTSPPPSFRSVALVGVLAFLSAVLINIATSQLPPGLQPYLWLSWPLAALVTGASIWVAYRESRSAPSSVIVGGTLDERNRARMLDKVERFWIKSVLEQSLYQIARLELGLEKVPEEIHHPWETVLQQATISRAVPAGTAMIRLFDDLDGKLLILGAPGSGKTTVLLELARDLIARARSDPQHPIPLVFNLSTWASNRKSLQMWLADELNQRYDVPRKLAQAWMDANAILPLLDGLDEVATDHQDSCVEAINTYRNECGLVSLVVCSRSEEYAALTNKLRLQGAICIQPLTQQIVDAYLHQIGRPLVAVRTLLRDDPRLRELLDNPLMLSIVVLAHKDKTPAKLRAVGTPDERRRQLFDDYIAAMFARPSRSVGTRVYQSQVTMYWLGWLGKQMMEHDQTVFYIERLQPDWLSQTQSRIVTSGLSLFVALVSALIGALLVDPITGISLGFLIGMYFYSSEIKIAEVIRWSLSRTALSLAVFGGVAGLLIWFELLREIMYPLVVDVQPISKPIQLSPTQEVVTMVTGIWLWLMLLSAPILFSLLLGLFAGLSTVEAIDKSKPNQGIYQSVRNVLFAGLAFGLVAQSTLSLFINIFAGIRLKISLGIIVGILAGANYGGRTVLQHYTLRWLLSRNGVFPFRDHNLIGFLDHCAERILLRKVGGGYIFVHRLLMEHFASLYTEGNPPEPVEAQQTTP